MSYTFLFLCLQTITLWFLVIFLHRKKEKITLIPLYSLLAVLTILTHNLSDLGFAITLGNWCFLIASFSFFTSLMLGVLFIYLFEGPRATRLALFIIFFTSILYIIVISLLNLQVDTTKWISLDYSHLVTYFWSISAIIIDVFFIAIFWELLEKIKKINLFIRIFLVILFTFLIDALIFVTGAFYGQAIYLQILYGDLVTRLVLAIIATPIVTLYLKSEKYNETSRKKPKNFWDILNFHSDLETEIQSMEEVLREEKELKDKLQKSEEKYFLALEGANAGIWDWDIEKNVINYSNKFTSLLGYESEDLKTTIEDFKKILHPEDLDRTFKLIDECFNNKKNYSIEYRLLTKDGSYKWFLSSGITKFNPEGKPIRMVGSIIDINEKKMISNSYEEKVKELETFNKLMINRELKMTELKEEINRINSK